MTRYAETGVCRAPLFTNLRSKIPAKPGEQQPEKPFIYRVIPGYLFWLRALACGRYISAWAVAAAATMTAAVSIISAIS